MGPGELGRKPAEAIAGAAVRAPTRGNRKLEALLDGINADPQVLAWWHMAQVTSERLAMSDHSWVHVQIVLNISLRLLRLLFKAGVQPAMVSRPRHARPRRRGCGRLRSAASRRRHVDPPRRPRGLQPVPGRGQAATELLADIYDEPERTVVISETLHAIIGHRRRGEPYTLEAGVVRVADALDMAQGRTRIPVESGRIGNPRALGGGDRRGRIEPGGGRAPMRHRDRDEQLGRDLPGRRPAGHQAPRHPARGSRRGRRRRRGRDREAAADRVPDPRKPRRRRPRHPGPRLRRSARPRGSPTSIDLGADSSLVARGPRRGSCRRPRSRRGGPRASSSAGKRRGPRRSPARERGDARRRPPRSESPQDCASEASMMRPVRISSRARPMPTTGGSRWVPPSISGTPQRRSG